MATLLNRPLKPLRHSGSSANLDYYGEPGPKGPGRVWAEVLCSAVDFRVKPPKVKRVPDYSVRVYVTGRGEVARADYAPKSRPTTNRLPARTVGRIVREALGA